MIASPAPPILWEPSEDALHNSTLAHFMRWLERERNLTCRDYQSLWDWSVTDIEAFWKAIWDFFEIEADGDTQPALNRRDMPGAKWFPNARVNYAEHIFKNKDLTRTAIFHSSELRAIEEIDWAQLQEQVARARTGLIEVGVEEGDRVVAYLPNILETVVAFLATASLGAIWSSCSPDFGARSVIDRFAQIEPKVLFTVDGYRYSGKDFDRADVIEQLEAELSSLEHTVVVPYLGDASDLIARRESTISWSQLLADEGELVFDRVPFDHPLWVLYSSGTTGLPKAIVHGHGGILLEHTKKLNLHVDARAGDRMFWYTTTGWMMWNFLVGALLTDAAIVLYDGSAMHPEPDVLWDLAAKTGMTCFGTSASYIAACMKNDMTAAEGRDLSALRSVGSTGSPLAPEGFRWCYDQLGSDVWLFSTSGGTDVCSAFVGGVPILPVYEGELQARALGAKVEAFDDDGNSVIEEVGELVLTEPLPSMPVFFWNDPEGERYRDSYFSMYPNVWRHGDWIRITTRGTAVIYGRSDATINRGGIRMGTAEIYRAVLAINEVTDALVVDLPRPGQDNFMPLFVVLRPGAELDDDLVEEIRGAIRNDCSPRHVPNQVIAIDAVPRTLSGKLLEVPVKKILLGRPVDEVVSRDALANPEALSAFVEFQREFADAGIV